MNKSKVYYQGKIYDASGFNLPFLNSSFLYGRALFETCLVRHKKVVFLKEHIERLRASALQLGMNLEASEAYFKKICEELIENNSDGILKVHLSENLEEYELLASKKEMLLLLYFRSHLINPSTPLTCFTSKEYQSAPLPLAQYKTSNYLYPFLLKNEAKKHQVDEIILQDEEGNLTEAATSNLFFVRGAKLHTPSLKQALLPGITRKIILEIARQEKIEVEERAIHESEINQFDEAFLSSSLSGIRPIRKMNQHHFDAPGKISLLLMKTLEERMS